MHTRSVTLIRTVEADSNGNGVYEFRELWSVRSSGELKLDFELIARTLARIALAN